MTKRVRKVLDQIEKVFLAAEGAGYGSPEECDARNLWTVLTALRNTDLADHDDAIKHSLTVPIRRAAFPKLAAAVDQRSGMYAKFGPQMGPAANYTRASTDSEHFDDHHKAAVRALDIHSIKPKRETA